MNNQLKLLLYIVFIVGVLFYLQDSFDLIDIAFVDNEKASQEKVDDTEKDGDEEETIIKEDKENYAEISVGDGEVIRVDVEVADTEALRALGLSNRKYLGDYSGMLFVFDEKVGVPFWMKETLINLDIIFIDEKGFVVDIKENNEPCTDVHCPQIVSKEPFKYVLEVKGGFCEINDVEVGQSITIHLAAS
jgi:uncharacterized protein